MFIVLHSSAGAGKTHALVKHYLAQCLGTKQVDAYRHVLALTFTNKAAGEMRERVIGYLKKLAAGSTEGAIPSLRQDLIDELGLTAADLQARADRTLHHMLHHWSDVAIGTIDSFTRRVVQPFARDLRMDHELRMTTDQDHYRNAAVDLLLAEAGKAPALTELLLATCAGLIEDEQAWRVDKPIRDLSAQLDKEQALEHLAALRDLGDRSFIDLDQRLRARINTFTTKVRSLGQSALDTLLAAGIKEKDVYQGRSGPLSYLRKLARFDRTLDPMGAHTAKALETDRWSSSSADPSTKAMLEGLGTMIGQVIREAENLRPAMREHTIMCAVQRDLMPSAVLHLLDRTLEDLKRTDAVVFFSDLTRKVAAVVQDEPAPFIFERLGERYRHFLIDEFQDTSLLQWQCLLPLVENALGNGGTVLLVGDAKQAIYRWRNGEVRQFIDMPKLFRKELLPDADTRERAIEQAYRPATPLVHNRRSASAIIGFNNDLFGALREVVPERFRSAYRDVAQEPHRKLEGLVQLRPLEEAEEEAPPPPLRVTSHCVREALEDGYAPGDIAVLVRSRNVGTAVAEHLVAEGHQVLSPDGLRLGGDPVCELILAVLGFLQHGDDVHAARAHQLLAIINATDTQVLPFIPRDGKPLNPPRAMQEWLYRHPAISLQMPVAECISKIAEAIGRSPAGDAYLLFLMNEAHACSLEHGPDVTGFLAHWERAGHKRAIELPPTSAAIRVMTIHASKGLQFPVVIIPDAEMRGRGAHRELLWMKPREVVPELPSALVRIDSSLLELEVPEVIEEAELKLLDEMNLLYVAFTRPEDRLYVGVDANSKSPIGAALLNFLGTPEEGSWSYGERVRTERSTPRSMPDMLQEVGHADWRHQLKLRCQSPQDWDPTDPDPDRTFGNIVHDLLASVVAPDDLDHAIQQAMAAGDLSAEQALILGTRLNHLLASPGMDRFYAKDLIVRNEATLISTDGKAYRPDRVVLGPDSTQVLDIKTGRPADSHHTQVANYINLLRELGLPQVSGHLLYVRSGSLTPVEA